MKPIKLFILMFLVMVILSGCKTSDNQPGSPTVSSGNTALFEIPSAKKIKPELKAKADEKIKFITTATDSLDRLDAAKRLEELCKENPSDFALFSYIMENPEGDVSKTGMRALQACYAGKMKDEEKAEEFEILSYAAKHPMDYIRGEAIMTMSYVSDTDERKAKQKDILKEAIKDKSANVRVRAIQLLAMINDKTSIDAIKEIMNGNDESPVRAAAMRALDRFGIDIKDKSMEILDTGDAHLKSCAMELLGRHKNKEAIPKLIGLLDDKTKTGIHKSYDTGDSISYFGIRATLQQMAIDSLEKITGEKFKGKDNQDYDGMAKKWKDWYEKNKGK